MASLLKKIEEIELRPSRLSRGEVDLRRKQIDDFMAITAFEGLHASALSLKLQELFVADKLTTSEYIALSRQHASELRV